MTKAKGKYHRQMREAEANGNGLRLAGGGWKVADEV